MKLTHSVRAPCALSVALAATFVPQLSIADISTAGIQDISTAGVLDISTAGIQDISTAGVLDISTAGIQDISTAGVLDISTAGVQDISTAGVLDISTAGLAEYGESEVLTGPIESINLEVGSFASMGQTVAASREMLADLRTGDLVTVEGSVMGPGWLYADRVSVSSERYVPGATEVFVTGIPTSVNRFTGQVEMGELTVDYTASLAGGDLRPGTVWTFRGIQPNNRGVLVAGEAANK